MELADRVAAVAFAEWLAVTYGQRGVRVSCLCPMGVRTRLLQDGLATPGEVSAGLRISTAAGRSSSPTRWPKRSCAGSPRRPFLILPHPQVRDLIQVKASDPVGWLAGMRAARASAATV